MALTAHDFDDFSPDEIYDFTVGDFVFWNDPDEGLCSDYATIVDVPNDGFPITSDTILVIETERGSIAEVFPGELKKIA